MFLCELPPAIFLIYTPSQIQFNGRNLTIIQVGATYNDLGAITGPQPDIPLLNRQQR